MTKYHTNISRVSLRCNLYCFSANALCSSGKPSMYAIIHLLLLIANRRMAFSAIKPMPLKTVGSSSANEYWQLSRVYRLRAAQQYSI